MEEKRITVLDLLLEELKEKAEELNEFAEDEAQLGRNIAVFPAKLEEGRIILPPFIAEFLKKGEYIVLFLVPFPALRLQFLGVVLCISLTPQAPHLRS